MAKSILDQLGLLRNPCLIFGMLGSILLFGFGREMLESEHSESRTLGIFIAISAVILIFATLGFYIYAYTHLPGNVQEAAFLNHIKEQVLQDKKIRARNKNDERKSKRSKK